MPLVRRRQRATHFEVDAGRLRVSVRNPDRGRPLLLVNGIGGSGDLWEPLRTHFDDRTTIAFDAPGVGGSPTPAFPPTMRMFARTVADLCDELSVGPVDVLGLSWGGLLAQELARRHSDLVRRLVLVATSAGWLSAPGEPSATSLLLSPARYYSAEVLRRAAPVLYGRDIEDQPELLERQIEIRLANPPSWIGYMHQMNALIGWSSLPWLHRIHQRTLVLAGDDDRFIRLVNSQALARLLPDARLHVVEGGGHLFVLTRADEMSALVSDFLDDRGDEGPSPRPGRTGGRRRRPGRAG